MEKFKKFKFLSLRFFHTQFTIKYKVAFSKLKKRSSLLTIKCKINLLSCEKIKLI